VAKSRGKDGPPGDGGEQPAFEQSLERLEEIVAELEGSDVPLERALALFEEGVKLGRACSARLDEAERKITLLLEKADGTLVEEPLSAAPGDAGPATPKPSTRARPAPKAAAKSIDDDGDDDSVPF
jgi:exodeoxyribonuclease VII small subunit